MKPEPYETIPTSLPTDTERLAAIDSALRDARWHIPFLQGEWDVVADLLAGIMEAQAALRKLAR